ncbi:MAG: selenide, water dikinase SelD [Bacteroidia bacterium]
MEEIKLMQYSHGAGCGCKIAPSVLENILKSKVDSVSNTNLLVGNSTKDDAAVYAIENGKALISTVDFFMPIVDDAFDFGRIASANAISDVYAMGGKPILATALLGWPINKLPVELAQRVLDGAKTICNQAGIPLAGGHSIDTVEPMFGLSVNGMVDIKNLKQNSTAQAGDLIYLTKPVGVGILAAAIKRGVLKEEHKAIFINQLTTLNSIGEQFGELPYLHAMTDVTGFGLLGHLMEMTEGSGLSAELNYEALPLINGLHEYLSKTTVPDNVNRNWKSFAEKVQGIGTESLLTLCDPQTNGGLLVSVDAAHQKEFELFLTANQLKDFAKPIGRMLPKTTAVISIINSR